MRDWRNSRGLRQRACSSYGEKEDKCLLGVTALEALGLEVAYGTSIALTGNERRKKSAQGIFEKVYIPLKCIWS